MNASEQSSHTRFSQSHYPKRWQWRTYYTTRESELLTNVTQVTYIMIVNGHPTPTPSHKKCILCWAPNHCRKGSRVNDSGLLFLKVRLKSRFKSNFGWIPFGVSFTLTTLSFEIGETHKAFCSWQPSCSIAFVLH